MSPTRVTSKDAFSLMRPLAESCSRQRAVAIALLLLAIYCGTVSAAFHSLDEVPVFAVARNLVLHGHPDQNALYWGDPQVDPAAVSPDGQLYSKYGIGHSLLVAVAVLIGRVVPGAGLATSAMLLDGLATALTGALLLLAAARLGYDAATGAILALLYGLATFAFVYARTMFGEPLVALGWLAAIYVLLGGQTVTSAFWAGLLVAATVTVRPALLALAPLFALPLLVRDWRISLARCLAFALPLLVCTGGLLAFNYWRFGNFLHFGYSETFNGSLPVGLVGLLFSPDRSLFLFAPPLLLLPWALPESWRRERCWTAMLLAIPVASLLLYSAWPVYWGGPVWGPRYLLPALPLLILLMAPFVQRARSRAAWPRAALLLVAGLGAAFQLPDVIWNVLPATQELGQRYPLWLIRPRAEWLDIAWLYGQRAGFLLAGLMFLAAILALLRPRRAWLATAIGVNVVCSFVILSWLGSSPLGYPYRAAYGSVLRQLQEQSQVGDALILNPTPYQSPGAVAGWFLNSQQLRLPFYGILRGTGGEVAPPAKRIDAILKTHGRVWLLVEGVGPGDAESTVEAYLARTAAIVRSDWLEDSYRLVLFEKMGESSASGRPEIALGQTAVLQSWEAGVHLSDGKGPASTRVHLYWRALTNARVPLNTFIQVLDRQGSLVNSWAGVPGAGFAPATGWHAGQLVEERVAIDLPVDTQGQSLQIVVGLYDPASGQRLQTPEGADIIRLTQIRW
jgi:hypothetical protein